VTGCNQSMEGTLAAQFRTSKDVQG